MTTIAGVLAPDWAAPAGVGALYTTRRGGVSSGAWGDLRGEGGLNLGANCGDDLAHVRTNRARLAGHVGMPVRWLHQVHGADVVEAVGVSPDGVRADAQLTCEKDLALGILVADCLPVLLADRAGRIVGAAHAGWRGLAAGVLENTVAGMRARRPRADLVAWLGPCIGPDAFEVGPEVREAFVADDAQAAAHFRPGPLPAKWFADLAALARRRLARAGVDTVAGSGRCTATDGEAFWSFRRDGACGRMAALVWLRSSV
jgi:YfiH family protein